MVGKNNRYELLKKVLDILKNSKIWIMVILYNYKWIINSNLNEEEFIIQEEELSEVKWFDIDEVIEMLKNNDERIAWSEERILLFEGLKKIIINIICNLI